MEFRCLNSYGNQGSWKGKLTDLKSDMLRISKIKWRDEQHLQSGINSVSGVTGIRIITIKRI